MATFTENWRNARKNADDSKETIKEFNDALDKFAKGYDKYYSAKYVKDTVGKNGLKLGEVADTIKNYKGGKDNAAKKIKDIILTAGKMDGELSDDSSEYDIAKYGTDFLNQLQNGTKDSFDVWFEKNATSEQKQAKKNMERHERYQREIQDEFHHEYDKPSNWGEAIAQGVDSGARTWGYALKDAWNTPDLLDYGFWKSGEGKKRDTKIMDEMHKKYDEYSAGLENEAYDMIYNYDEDMKEMVKQGKEAYEEIKKKLPFSGSSSGSSSDSSSDDDYVEFTLTKANDPNYRGFGQKIIDLGLNTENGLWGENGDVAYYTKQLNDQGIYGNLPVGKTIRLKRRK